MQVKMENFFKSISKYNVANYLIPGVVTVLLLRATNSFNLVQDELFLGLFLYYFIGLILSRIGSLLVEPVLKGLKVIDYTPYSDFVLAIKKDSAINELSETNSSYRTYIVSMFVVLIAMPAAWVIDKFSLPNILVTTLTLVLAAILLAFAYRKQTIFIKKRVEESKK